MRIEIVELLLFAGANPDIADADGHTPLMVASRAGDVKLVRKLLSPVHAPSCPIVTRALPVVRCQV